MNKIYLINTPIRKSMNAFIEKNTGTCEFERVEKASANMQNVLFADTKWNEEVVPAITRRLKFQSYRPNTAYRCMFLDLRSGKVTTFHNMDEFNEYRKLRKTQFANYCFDTTANRISYETEQWLEVAETLTHGKLSADLWTRDRQNFIDKCNLYLSDVDFDGYNAGHLVPTMKKNVHVFTDDYKFFDLQFQKGDCSQHDFEREAEHYEVSELEILKNFCHCLTCSRLGVDIEDSKGNAGRVTRESIENHIVNYSELAEMINASEDRDYYIELLQNGTSIEDVAAFFDCIIEDTDAISYREF